MKSTLLLLSVILAVVSAASESNLRGDDTPSQSHAVDYEAARARAGDSCALGHIDGFLIDLDGTMYGPNGLLHGAVDFYKWLKSTGIPFVFLSNSGSKGQKGVTYKFLSEKFNLDGDHPVSDKHIYTSANAAARYVIDKVPEGSKVHVLQTESEYVDPQGNKVKDSFHHVLLQMAPDANKRWDIKLDLDDLTAKQWARAAKNGENVFVVYSSDGFINGESHPSGWNYEVMSRVGWILHNGGTLINSAPDTHTFRGDPDFTDIDLSTPGPGVFYDFFRSNSYPKAEGRLFTVGKGGNAGDEYMMGKGMEMLKAQGASGLPGRTAMIGDTLNTDIRAARISGMTGIFVLSGFHQPRDFKYYPDDVPTCVLGDVGDIPEHHKIQTELI